MRVLVVSDIHGNWSALQAVAAAVPHDAVLCLGDIVGYGPEPAACLRWLRENRAQMVQGNHDRAFADDVRPRCRPDFEWLATAAAGIARQQLDDEEKAFLRNLPRTRSFVIDGRRVLMVHATPADPLYRYLGPDPPCWRSSLAGVEADIVLVGHTHLPFRIHLDGIAVVNPGSVGQPKDGDPRAAFGLIDGGVPMLEKISYPVDRTIEGLRTSGVGSAALDRLAALLRTGRAA